MERSCAETHGRNRPPPLARSRSHLDKVRPTRPLVVFEPQSSALAIQLLPARLRCPEERAESPLTGSTVLTLRSPLQVLLLRQDQLSQDRAAADQTPGYLTSQCTCGCRGTEL